VRRRYSGADRPCQTLQRLIRPVNDVLQLMEASPWASQGTRKVLIQEMHRRQTSFWNWTHDAWIDIFCPTFPLFNQRYHVHRGTRPQLLAVAYLLNDFTDIHVFGHQKQVVFAFKVFGRKPVEEVIHSVSDELLRWGYGTDRAKRHLANTLCELLLLNRSPRLEDLSLEILEQARQGNIARYLKTNLPLLSRALVSLGYLPRPLPVAVKDGERFGNHDALADVPPEWLSWSQRWYQTSTLSSRSRQGIYYQLLKVGRWLAQRHPEALVPGNWTRDLAVEYVAVVDRMMVGEWARATKMYPDKLGKPLSARAKVMHLNALRTFFLDGQEWGWFPHRFDVRRCLAAPRAVRALIAPDPRVISEDIWAKLLWAGLNLKADDLPASTYLAGSTREKRDPWYPIAMVRALVLTWLFAGLRSDELVRLRVGCVRWQREETRVPGTDESLCPNAICWLDVPVHKTGTAFTKAVDLVVGEAITEWERVRPVQPAGGDPKTGELVHYLFCYRGQRIGKPYLNRSVIPALCRKAGLPRADARGNITSHRARSTIATQLYNAKEPLSLFDLQEWLGHHNLASTQAYAKKSPTKVAKAYEKAGYFGRNLRTVEVLIDQDAIKSGAAAAGSSWRFYDLGHGYCLYEFFDQCPHRMACAKCSFYRPKGSSQAQLLEGKANLLRMLQEIPLSEEERAAVEDGIEAMAKLCRQLADIPTPAGPTPNQLFTGHQKSRTVIPLEEVRRKR
jgi:integrase